MDLKDPTIALDETNSADEPEYRTIKDPALQYAWQYYITYDTVSTTQKMRHNRQRRQIILLGFVATVIAVFLVPLPVANFIASMTGFSDFIMRIRWIFLVAAPISLSAMMAYTLQFSPSMAWVVHRVGAEKIRREIYLYRMDADGYSDTKLTEFKKQQMLREVVNVTREEIEKIDVPIPAHRVTKTLTEADVAAKTDDKADQGFLPLSATEYMDYRVIPQRTWYVNKINEDYQNLRRIRTRILLVGGLGTLVAAFGNGWEQYVAITTAGVAALTTYTQLKLYGQVYPMYHSTVGKLDAVVAEWMGLSHSLRDEPEHRASFVKQIENIFNDERLKWMDQATQAMVNGDQSLMRNVSDWTRGFGNQPVPEPEAGESKKDVSRRDVSESDLPIDAQAIVLTDTPIPALDEMPIVADEAAPIGDMPVTLLEALEQDSTGASSTELPKGEYEQDDASGEQEKLVDLHPSPEDLRNGNGKLD